MQEGVCLGRTFLWFLTKEVFAREWCRERGKSAMRSSTEKNEPLADSAPGLAAPPPHLFRTPFRHAYAGLRTCRRHESLPSQYAQPALTRLVRRSHHRRLMLAYVAAITAPPPSSRLGRASDGTDRAVPPSGPSAKSIRHWGFEQVNSEIRAQRGHELYRGLLNTTT
jgi:hypothetical protein